MYSSSEKKKLNEAATDEQVFTVDEAIEACGFGQFQIRLSIFSGLIWLVDAMEIMLLAILGPAARCEFGLTAVEESLIATIVFAGVFIGSGPWGAFMDKYGRRKGLFILCVFVCFAGLASAFSFSYWFLLFSRCLVGVGIAGGTQAVTFYSEFLPRKQRAYCLIFIQVFFAAGTLLEVVLALLVMGHGNLGWHYLLGFTTIPLFLDLFAFLLVPESARFYVASGKMDKAREVLERVARINKRSLPPGKLVAAKEKAQIVAVHTKNTQGSEKDGKMSSVYNSSYDIDSSLDSVAGSLGDDQSKVRLISIPKDVQKKNSRGRFVDLFYPGKQARTTVLLWIIWFGAAFGYYGIVLLTTELLDIIKDFTDKNLTDGSFMPCYDYSIQGNSTNETHCNQLNREDYLHMLWTTSAELPGILFTALIIERIGRKKTMAVEFGGCIIAFFLMYICPINKYLLMFLIFVGRGLITGAFQAAYVYTPEVYPTPMRAIGLGMCSSMSRIGAMVTPFIAQVVTRQSIRGAEGAYAGVCLIAGICALLLPVETKGRRMEDTVEDEEKNS
eukprot:m.111001 g.111001  ORF g.111001 m.111001 type:complete len:557 (+) comp37417_c0_seq4:57-1727(+)